MREGLLTGHLISGPALIIEPNQTVVIEDGWQAEVGQKIISFSSA